MADEVTILINDNPDAITILVNEDVGPNGLSAYQIAVSEGFVGTEEQWLDSLDGSNGLSAYDIAVQNGFEGTEAQWLASLKGQGTNTTVVAAVDIPAYSVVNADGTIADSSVTNKATFVIGISTSLISTGFAGNIDTGGEITNGSWTWTAGQALYLSTSGQLSHFAPTTGFIQKIATAKNSNTIEINISPSIII